MVIPIQISDEVWKYLMAEKKQGESHNDVLERKLKIKNIHGGMKKNESNKKTA